MPSFNLRIFWHLCALWFFLAAAAAPAQMPVPGAVPSRSASGQFLVYSVPGRRDNPMLVYSLETNRNFVRLDATLLPVSCERIKQVLSRQLGLSAPWSGKIFLGLYPAGSAEDPITITPGQFRDGWQYRVELPDLVERSRYVQAVVQVLLLEVANRTAAEHSAEIPLWLSEGFCQHLLLSSEIEIILPPPQNSVNGLKLTSTFISARKEDPLELVRKQLCASPPLTFQQLSWPNLEQFGVEQSAVYRCSAYFFVDELLRLDDGRACFRAMLTELPQHYNWQFAFLRAFRSHFQRPLDVEKWWALHLEHFTGRERGEIWSPEESWKKLDSAIRSAVEVRVGTNELPFEAEVKLQTIISSWERPRQTQALEIKLRELEVLRLRLGTNVVALADDYHRTIADYLQNRDRGWIPLRKKAQQRHVVQETLRQLEALDSRRLELRPVSQVPPMQASSQPAR
jgi:hypothetical protein